PERYGGRGATPAEHLIFLEEATPMGAPAEGVHHVGLLPAGPTLILEGTPEQQARHLPPILKGEQIWCQAFSEPGAGSDLASLQTRAVRDGDEYVVNGQKTWTSGAQYSKYMILIARTDPDAPKHRGISYFIVDMETPGIDVRPLVNMVGSAD